jgi:cobalt/nickel transport system permease protein
MWSQPYIETSSLLHRCDPRLKTVGTLLYIIAVAAARPRSPVLWMLLSAILLCLTLCANIPLTLLLRRIAPVLWLVGLAVLGGLLTGEWERGLTLSMRCLLCAYGVALLSATTRFLDLIASLQWMRTPSLFLSLLLLTHRYLSVLSEEAVRMRRAWQSRGGAINSVRALIAFSRLIHALLWRSVERSERIANAMISRGFEERLPVRPLAPLRPSALLWMAAFGGALILLLAGTSR